MYCPKCGAQNKDHARFCFSCGANLGDIAIHPEVPAAADPVAPVTPEPVAPAPAPIFVPTPTEPVADPIAPQKPKKRVKKIVTTIIIVFVLLALIATAAFFVIRELKFRNMAEDIVEHMLNVDIKALCNQMNDDVLEQELGSQQDIKEFIEYQEYLYKPMLEHFNKTYEEWEVAYKATHVRHLRGDDLAALQEYYDEYYDLEVTAAKHVNISITVNFGDTSSIGTCLITLVKIDGEWCLDLRDTVYSLQNFWNFLSFARVY